MRTTRALLVAACTAAALAAAGCGDDDGGQAAATAPQAHTTGTDTSMDGMEDGASGGSMGAMAQLASVKRDDMTIALMAMPPETFYVSQGATWRKQTPGAGDDAHLMVTLTDTQSGVRLPDATVTARVTGPGGRVAFEGPLYPMIGRGMGMHYGENVDLGDAGAYDVALTVGPPRIGRHRDVATAWTHTERVDLHARYDGKALMPGS